jgi:DNA-binding Lrp family transcriptional regulator
LDTLDIKILGQLGRGFSSHGFEPEVKGAYGRIAKNLGLDEDTIRKRVDRLESAGVIKGWYLIPNPNALGVKTLFVDMILDPKLKIDEIVRKLKLVFGVIRIFRYVGDGLGVALLIESEEMSRKRAELIAELVGPKELKTYASEGPRVDVSLTSTDYEIIKALRPDPLVSHAELAQKLGLSSKTVSRRLSRLAQGNVLFFMPNIDYSRLEGVSCVDLFVNYTSTKFKGAVDTSVAKRFPDYLLRVGWGSANHGHFSFLVPSLAVAQQIMDWARGLQGVRDVDLRFLIDTVTFSDDAVEEVLRAKLAIPKRNG